MQNNNDPELTMHSNTISSVFYTITLLYY